MINARAYVFVHKSEHNRNAERSCDSEKSLCATPCALR